MKFASDEAFWLCGSQEERNVYLLAQFDFLWIVSDVLDRCYNLVVRENSASSLGRHLFWNLGRAML